MDQGRDAGNTVFPSVEGAVHQIKDTFTTKTGNTGRIGPNQTATFTIP